MTRLCRDLKVYRSRIHAQIWSWTNFWLTCAIPEPIKPPPITVTFFIMFGTTVLVEKLCFSIANGRDMFLVWSDNVNWNFTIAIQGDKVIVCGTKFNIQYTWQAVQIVRIIKSCLCIYQFKANADKIIVK